VDDDEAAHAAVAASAVEHRRRYRVTPAPALIYGHSQGAAFAHTFTLAHPAKRFVATNGAADASAAKAL
jgi:predicted esterase